MTRMKLLLASGAVAMLALATPASAQLIGGGVGGTIGGSVGGAVGGRPDISGSARGGAQIESDLFDRVDRTTRRARDEAREARERAAEDTGGRASRLLSLDGQGEASGAVSIMRGSETIEGEGRGSAGAASETRRSARRATESGRDAPRNATNDAGSAKPVRIDAEASVAAEASASAPR